MLCNARMVLLVPVIPGVVITEPGAVSWDADLLDASARGLEYLGLAIAQVVVTSLQPYDLWSALGQLEPCPTLPKCACNMVESESL